MDETSFDTEWKWNTIRGDEEEIRNILPRIKRTVDKGWPDDMNGTEAAKQDAEREAQGRQRR